MAKTFLNKRLSSDYTLFNLNDPETTKFYISNLDFFISHFPHFKEINTLTMYFTSGNVKFNNRFLTKINRFLEIIEYTQEGDTIDEGIMSIIGRDRKISSLSHTLEGRMEEETISNIRKDRKISSLNHTKNDLNFLTNFPKGEDFTRNSVETVLLNFSKIVGFFSGKFVTSKIFLLQIVGKIKMDEYALEFKEKDLNNINDLKNINDLNISKDISAINDLNNKDTSAINDINNINDLNSKDLIISNNINDLSINKDLSISKDLNISKNINVSKDINNKDLNISNNLNNINDNDINNNKDLKNNKEDKELKNNKIVNNQKNIKIVNNQKNIKIVNNQKNIKEDNKIYNKEESVKDDKITELMNNLLIKLIKRGNAVSVIAKNKIVEIILKKNIRTLELLFEVAGESFNSPYPVMEQDLEEMLRQVFQNISYLTTLFIYDGLSWRNTLCSKTYITPIFPTSFNILLKLGLRGFNINLVENMGPEVINALSHNNRFSILCLKLLSLSVPSLDLTKFLISLVPEKINNSNFLINLTKIIVKLGFQDLEKIGFFEMHKVWSIKCILRIYNYKFKAGIMGRPNNLVGPEEDLLEGYDWCNETLFAFLCKIYNKYCEDLKVKYGWKEFFNIMDYFQDLERFRYKMNEMKFIEEYEGFDRYVLDCLISDIPYSSVFTEE